MIGWNFWRRLEILERWIDCRSPPHVNKTENNTVGLFSCRAFGFLFVLSHRKFFFSGANFLFLRVFGHFTDHKRPIDRMSTENFQGWCFGRRPITFFCFACISVCLPLFFFFSTLTSLLPRSKLQVPSDFMKKKIFLAAKSESLSFQFFIWFDLLKEEKKEKRSFSFIIGMIFLRFLRMKRKEN